MRISATLLESYRRWLDADEEYADQIEQELQAKIRGEFSGTREMRLGTAYHAILEKPQRSLSGMYEQDGFQFEEELIAAMLRLLPAGGVFEEKSTRDILIPGIGVVTLVAKADHLYGAHLSEFKTTLSGFDSEKYMASYQWRVMAFLFEPEIITYHVACLSEDRQTGVIGLRSLESLNVFPYPALEADIRKLVREFCGYVTSCGLEDYLRFPRVTPAPVPRERTVVVAAGEEARS